MNEKKKGGKKKKQDQETREDREMMEHLAVIANVLGEGGPATVFRPELVIEDGSTYRLNEEMTDKVNSFFAGVGTHATPGMTLPYPDEFVMALAFFDIEIPTGDRSVEEGEAIINRPGRSVEEIIGDTKPPKRNR